MFFQKSKKSPKIKMCVQTRARETRNAENMPALIVKSKKNYFNYYKKKKTKIKNENPLFFFQKRSINFLKKKN